MAFQNTLNRFGISPRTNESGQSILMPKLKYRFRVTMSGFGISGFSESISLTRQVESCARPQISHESTPIHSYNNVVYIPKKPEWQPIEIKVRDDVSNTVTKLISAQLQKQMNHFDQTSALAGSNFKFTTFIQTLDGGNGVPLEEWYLEGCYLQSVNYDSFDYTSSDPVAITMTVRFDNATQGQEIMPPTALPNILGDRA